MSATRGPVPVHDVDVVLAGFARALRSAGVPVTPDRTATFLRAAAEVGADDPDGVYWAGRATLLSDPDQRAVYDAVHAAWFGGQVPRLGPADPNQRPRMSTAAPLVDAPGAEESEGEQQVVRALASEQEVLRHRDVAELAEAEREAVSALLATLRPAAPRRPSARRRPSRRGELDAGRTLRAQMRAGGEPARPRFRRRSTRSRRVVWLVDVSGSMSPYADALLRLAHSAVRADAAKGRARVEVFTVGTRLTRITPALVAHRDVEAALRAAGEQVPDWSGGTRLGEVLRAFLDRWGQRGLARGAVVVVCSDGWERGDPSLLGEQVERLHRLAHRVVWLNPHRGKEGYLPVQGGIAAVLPHVDDFVAGHSLATYAEVLEVVARA